MTRRRTAIPLLVALCALASCGGSAKPSAPAHTTADAPSTDPSRAVVEVQGDYGNHRTIATGFVYDTAKGLVLAPDHAVEEARSVLVTLADGTPVHGQVLARAMCHDLAVMRLSPRPADLDGLGFATSPVRKGDVVSSLDFEGGDQPTVRRTRGIVSAVGAAARLNMRLPTFSPLVSHYTPLSATASGSPLIDSRGQVIGINTMVDGDYGDGAQAGFVYALASSAVTRLLGQLRPSSGKTTYDGWSAEHRCHEQMDAIVGVHGRMGGNSMDMGQMGEGSTSGGSAGHSGMSGGSGGKPGGGGSGMSSDDSMPGK